MNQLYYLNTCNDTIYHYTREKNVVRTPDYGQSYMLLDVDQQSQHSL